MHSPNVSPGKACQAGRQAGVCEEREKKRERVRREWESACCPLCALRCAAVCAALRCSARGVEGESCLAPFYITA